MPRLVQNKEKNGIELYFDGKPDSAVLDTMKKNGWRWNPPKKCWYNKYSLENMLFARQLCGEEEETDIDEPVLGGLEPPSMGRVEPLIEGRIEYPGGNRAPENRGDPFLVKAVSEMISEFGISIFTDRYKAVNLFADYFVGKKKYLNVARIAVREGLIDRLVKDGNKPTTVQRATLDSSIRYMTDELGMGYEASAEVLLSFQAAINKSISTIRGKSICHQLKDMRRRFADINGIPFEEEECTHEGPCAGTCPYCDSKTKELNDKAKQLGKNPIYPDTSIDDEGRDLDTISDLAGMPVMMGMDDEDNWDDFEDLPFN